MATLIHDGVETKYVPLDATELDKPVLKQKQDEIGESEESRTRCLELLMKSLKELKDIAPCLDEDYLLQFLRVSKFDSSKACERIKKIYRILDSCLLKLEKNSIPISLVQSMPYFLTLPYRMGDCSALLVIKMGVIDYSKITFNERTCIDFLVVSGLITNIITQMCGVTIIFDYAGFSIRSLLAFKLPLVIQYMDAMQNAIPVRIKAIHAINTPSFYNMFHNILLSLFSKKLKDRVFLHPKNDGWKSLHKYITPNILPEEYGGYLKQTAFINLLENTEDLEISFQSMLKYGYVKTKDRRMLIKFLVSEK